MHSSPTLHSPLFVALAALFAAGCARDEERDPLARPEPFVRDVLRAESAVEAVHRSLDATLVAGLSGPDADLVLAAFTEDFTAHYPDVVPFTGDVPSSAAVASWQATDSSDVDGPALAKRLFSVGRTWRTTERASFELDQFFLAQDGTRATGRAELRLAGRTDDVRSDYRVTCRVAVSLGSDGRWRLSYLSQDEGLWVSRDGPGFSDVTAETGFDFHDSAENRRMAQSFIDRQRTLALGGLSALDWNGDGFCDLLATRKGQTSVLFLNDGSSGFVPAPLPIDAPRECPSFFLFVDLDGDGQEELIGSNVIRYAGDRAYALLYTRSGSGEWRRVEGALEFPNPIGRRRIAVQTIVPFDADGDGRLDLFMGVYGHARSRGEDYNTVEAHDGGDNFLFMNRGDLEFVEESEQRGIKGTLYTYVACAFDFDADGDTDLFEGNDFGPNFLWQNDGAGRFTPDEGSGLGGVSAYTMGVTLGDYDNTGEWSLYIANMSAEAGERIARIAPDVSEPMRARVATIAQGNMLYTQESGGAFREHGVGSRVAEGEWAWGSVFCDLDNDADKDLFVTNGFTSHADRALSDWDPYYWHQVAADGGFLERGERTRNVNAGVRFEGSFSGYQRDRLFLNRNDSAGFADAAYVFGLDADHDGRAAVPVDVDGDGDLDLALWTLQGLRLFENRLAPRHFTRVHLVATETHPSALGAVVSVTAGGVTQRDHVKLVEGFQSQVPADLHFGLADAERIERVSVAWPSGEVDEWRDLPADRRIALVEGADEARVAPLPAWPKAGRFAPERLPQDVAAGEAGAVVFALPPTETVAAMGIEDLRLFQAGGGAPPDGVQSLDDRSFIDEVSDAATYVYDREGRLARAFDRLATSTELSAVAHLLRDEAPFPELLVQTGRQMLSEARYREALRAFERALAVDDTLATACEGLARAHSALGRPDLAEKDYERAVALDPDYGLGHYNLGVTRTQLGRPTDAIEPLERALAIAGDNEQFLLSLGEAASLAGNKEKALDAFERATRSAPESVAAHVSHGKMLGQLGRYDEARAAFEAALALDPQHAEARRALALVERLQKGRD